MCYGTKVSELHHKSSAAGYSTVYDNHCDFTSQINGTYLVPFHEKRHHLGLVIPGESTFVEFQAICSGAKVFEIRNTNSA